MKPRLKLLNKADKGKTRQRRREKKVGILFKGNIPKWHDFFRTAPTSFFPHVTLVFAPLRFPLSLDPSPLHPGRKDFDSRKDKEGDEKEEEAIEEAKGQSKAHRRIDAGNDDVKGAVGDDQCKKEGRQKNRKKTGEIERQPHSLLEAKKGQELVFLIELLENGKEIDHRCQKADGEENGPNDDPHRPSRPLYIGARLLDVIAIGYDSKGGHQVEVIEQIVTCIDTIEEITAAIETQILIGFIEFRTHKREARITNTIAFIKVDFLDRTDDLQLLRHTVDIDFPRGRRINIAERGRKTDRKAIHALGAEIVFPDLRPGIGFTGFIILRDIFLIEEKIE